MPSRTAPRRCSAILVSLAAGSAAIAQAGGAIPLNSFEGDSPAVGVATNATTEVVSGVGVTDGAKALRIRFAKDSPDAVVTFTPDRPWDCSALGPCRFSFDATNEGPTSMHLRCKIVSGGRGQMQRSVAVAVGGTETCYFELSGNSLKKDYGLRDDPPAHEGLGKKMVVHGRKYGVDFSTIRSISFYVIDVADEDSVVIDNLRVVSNPPETPGFLENLVDEFGQRTAAEFDAKVTSDEELKRRAKDELAELAAGGPLSDRSRFGGWKDGPRLKATGYFRPEKVGGRWTLVDPEGYLHFATGIDNLRMANTSTFTGIDFRDDSVRYRDPEDVTPEDSIGIAPSSDAARATSYVAYPDRSKMFTWLPGYDHPLAKHYGYRRSQHIGPFAHGEVFSFYRANLERRYGEAPVDQTMATWRRVTIDRMQNWGFTCLGNWTDASFYQNDRIPYFANGWIIGDFKTVPGRTYWHPMPDPFDPEFARRAEVTTRVIADEVKGSPWCVGVFIDNEKQWGNSNSTKDRYGIVINTLAIDAADSPTKSAWVDTLKQKYGTIERLNNAWGAGVASWDDFAAGFPKQEKYEDAEQLADFSTLLEIYAEQYFKTVHDALERVMPNHLYLGCRMTAWGMTPESRKAASRYCDVMSYNFYREALGTHVWDFLPEVDRPSIIGEWHIGATDSGLPHPGLVHAADQEDRGAMYKTYMKSVVDNPYFVGAHWFQYIDSPITGRAHDGENYNVGFVTVADVPYQPLVDAAKSFNRTLYQEAYGALRSP